MSDDNNSPLAEQLPLDNSLHFPKHNRPRVWFLTDGNSPIAIALAKHLIEHGDCVVAGTSPPSSTGNEDPRDGLTNLENELFDEEERQRLKRVAFDIASMSECQAAVATAVGTFGSLDVVLCCNGETLMVSIEEVSQSPSSQSLITNQFNTNFFGPVNIIKSALPRFRAQKSGHILLLTGITGHLGTPGLGMYCASQWAIEGYCDSLAYEIAPFNIKMSIVQSSIEVSILTNKITAAPALEAYSEENNRAPLARRLWSSMLDRLDEAAQRIEESKDTIDPTLDGDTTPISNRTKPSELLNSEKAAELYPNLPEEFTDLLIAETVHALAAIGGHENPPARHIVGYEGIASVKEKLRTVSEELEDFFDVSSAVDL